MYFYFMKVTLQRGEGKKKKKRELDSQVSAEFSD